MEQRLAFDPVADVYKTARPGYPEALVEDVVAYAELKQNDKILEIGCGTGQATKSFAWRGFLMTAIDPGPEMIRCARESLAGFSNVGFLQTAFEDLSAKPESFDWLSLRNPGTGCPRRCGLRRPRRRSRLRAHSRCSDTFQ